jgi:RNA polymerase sigma factor (TIGR02999 family)
MRQGDSEAGEQAVSLVYRELHRIAGSQMRRERPGHTLQTTALVHEAYLRMAGGAELEYQNRTHFFALASQQMRRILVDYARAESAQRRGGGAAKVDIENIRLGSEPQYLDVLLLDAALKELEVLDPRATKVVELTYFGGYTQDEIMGVLNVSKATVRRDWNFARSWLFDRIGHGSRAD